jgi:hypothetical protein
MKAYIKKKTPQFIETLLTDKEYLRDNDEKLVANVIYQFLLLGKYDPHTLSAFQLLNLYAEGNLPTVDYITRIRRKIQETNPALRGLLYQQRQKKSSKVKKTINKNDIDEVL